MIQHLKALGNKEILPSDVSNGICAELLEKFNYKIPLEVIIEWWHFRFGYGTYYFDFNYFIPDPTDNNFPVSKFLDTKNKWDDSEYANYRRDFCLFLADWLQHEKI